MTIYQRPVNENHAQYGIYLRILTAACGSASFIFPAPNVSLMILDAMALFASLCDFVYMTDESVICNSNCERIGIDG